MEKLTDTDFKILDYINKNQPIHIDKIKTKFFNISEIEYRIELLSQQEFNKFGDTVPNSSYIHQEYIAIGKGSFQKYTATGIYCITDFGKKALHDYKVNSKIHKRELWLKSAWMPILVTLATNLLIIGIKALLPLILEWFSNIL